jgi:hypothetical protein
MTTGVRSGIIGLERIESNYLDPGSHCITASSAFKMGKTMEEMLVAIIADIETNQERMIADMDALQESMDSHHEGLSRKYRGQDGNRSEKIGGHGFGCKSRRKKAVAEQQEVPKEEAAVGTIGSLEDQYGDRHLAVGHCQQLKKHPG